MIHVLRLCRDFDAEKFGTNANTKIGGSTDSAHNRQEQTRQIMISKALRIVEGGLKESEEIHLIDTIFSKGNGPDEMKSEQGVFPGVASHKERARSKKKQRWETERSLGQRQERERRKKTAAQKQQPAQIAAFGRVSRRIVAHLFRKTKMSSCCLVPHTFEQLSV